MTFFDINTIEKSLKIHFYLVLIKGVLFRILEKITTVTKIFRLMKPLEKQLKQKQSIIPKDQ